MQLKSLSGMIALVCALLASCLPTWEEPDDTQTPAATEAPDVSESPTLNSPTPSLETETPNSDTEAPGTETPSTDTELPEVTGTPATETQTPDEATSSPSDITPTPDDSLTPPPSPSLETETPEETAAPTEWDPNTPLESSPTPPEGTPEELPPSIEGVTIEPSTGGELTVFQCAPYGWTDPNNDPEAYVFQWYVNGVPASSEEMLDGDFFSKGDMLRCQATPYDDTGPGQAAVSQIVSISNTPPDVEGLTIVPDPLYVDSVAQCKIQGYADADGDTIQTRFGWLMNDEELEDTSQNLNDIFFRGDVLRCWAEVSDGDAQEILLESYEVTVENSPPSIKGVDIDPSQGSASTTFTASPRGWFDADGDSPEYAYMWYVNAAPASEASSIYPGEFQVGDTLRVEVTPLDAYDAGTSMDSATLTVGAVENPPSIGSVELTPEVAFEASTLSCTAFDVWDPDGDDVTLFYSWNVAGELVEESANSSLTGQYFDKHDTVQCTVTPTDDSGAGGAVSSNTVTISNSYPTLSGTEITPNEPTRASTLSCSISVAQDDDGDPLTVGYAWFINGAQVAGASSATLSNAYFVSGDVVSCAATPFDDESSGQPTLSNEVEIQDTPPQVGSVMLTPASAYESTVLVCTADNVMDIDGDEVTLRYVWLNNEQIINGQVDSTLDGEFFSKNDGIQCKTTPETEQATGVAVFSNLVTILDSPPTIGSISLGPSMAYESTTLSCTPSELWDDDGDSIALSYTWTVNSELVSGQSSNTLTGSFFDRGDTVQCAVTPNDGTTDGTSKSSNAVTIENTKPVISTPTLTPTVPYVDTTLVCSASASDDDDDSVTLSYSWAVNSVTLPAQTEQTLSGVFEKGDSVTCAMTPNDGSENGLSKVSNAVTILNTAPTITTPTISPSTAYVGSTLTCSTNASDKDSDSVSLHYVWKINGSTASGQSNQTLFGVFEKGDSVTCTVTPTDDEGDGSAKTSNPMTISNTNPSASIPTLSPTPAYVTSDIFCSTSTSDADGDSVNIGYVWKVNGSTVTEESSSTLNEHFSKGDSVTCTVTPFDGTSYGTAKTSTGLTISNSKPTASDVAISPSTAYADDTLSCSASGSDADGDTVAFSYTWRVNGSVVSGQTSSTLSGIFSKEDSITCTVTPNDGTANGTAKTSGAVEIQNSAPSATTPALTPNPATVVSILSCSTTGSDIDDDSVTIAFAWTVNGSTLSGQTSSTLAGQFEKGDSVSCTVTPNDGTINGPAKTSSALTISNSAPEATKPTISPTSAYADDELTCSTSINDEDGDSVVVGFVWKVNGSTVEDANQNTLSGGFVKGNSVVCVVTPNDGTEDGDSQTSSAVTIKNSKPSATTPVISPNPAYADDTLTCETTTSDVDVSDTVTVTYSWMVNSVTVSETGSTLTEVFEKGDRVACVVTPNDGTASGSSKVSSSVDIDNSAPTATTPTLSPTEAYADSTLTCTTTTDDVDGDMVTVTYTWLVNGSTLPDETSSTLSGAFSKGDEVKCKVTPFDGSSPGGIRTSAGVTILNSAPSATKPTITPSLADVDTTLMCNTTTSDADDETVTITYGWKIGSSTVSGETDSTLSGVFERGDSITCSVTPTDGDATGTKMTSDALEISNALPSISSVTLSPTTAYEDSTLECTPSGASDPDGDSVSYGYEWYVEGAKVSGQTGSSLTGTYFSKGDSVYCKVTPNDGYDDGSPKSSSTVVIQNSAPSIAAATISPDPAYANDDLTCSATGADDVDGDTISYSYVWYVNSNVQGETSNTLSSGFVGGDGVKCRITPSDGTTLGTPKTSSSVIIQTGMASRRKVDSTQSFGISQPHPITRP